MINLPDMPLTIKVALQWGNSFLQKKRGNEDYLEAELIMAFCLSKERAYLLAHLDDVLEKDIWDKYNYYINLRAENYPLQYITGKQNFMALDFRVSPAVLIPRSDTEVLVEKILVLAREFTGEVTIADIGTGSGAIAVSLAKYLPNARVVAVDISREALTIAEKNANDMGVSGQINFRLGNLFEPLACEKFQIIVSNPPYISRDEYEELEPQVKDWEPEIALIGGSDGLDYYREIICQARHYLTDKAYLALEIGWKQGRSLIDLMKREGYSQLELIQDWGNRDRVLVGKQINS